MWQGHFRLALQSIRTAKWRSFLTMLGIIIGVASVITTVSLGEGVKHQISSQVTHFGSDLITVRPGRLITRDKDGKVVQTNLLSGNLNSLSEHDFQLLAANPSLRATAPFSIVSGAPSFEKNTYDTAVVIGTTPQMSDVLSQKLAYGDFLNAEDAGKQEAVLGPTVAQKLFNENVPIGKTFTLKGQEFIVRGIFDEFKGDPLGLDIDFNNVIFIPYETSKAISNGSTQIFEILSKPKDGVTPDQAVRDMRTALLQSHGGQQDFSILKQGETLAVASGILNLLTTMVAGIAVISLIVGGIGVMNVMLVAVSERLHEIGIRKAVGATNRQILGQFLVEAVMLSFSGGVIGVITALLVGVLVQLGTHVQPVITWQIIVLSLAVSLGVGIIFGVTPAVKAARKDPIDALRHQ